MEDPRYESLLPIPPHLAGREFLRRQAARDSLIGFAQAIEIPGAPISDDPDEWLFRPVESGLARHHLVMLDAIERCLASDYGRLMLFFPPGAAKSTYASVVAPAYIMGKVPGIFVLMTSYAATPIIRHSKRGRQICASPQYGAIWGARLRDGERAANEWELTSGSHLFASGLLGGITSSRCDVGIIDDPVAGRQEADSPTTRATTRAAYDDDFLTRLKPRASIILIQTRWHPEDLAGSILPENYDGRSGRILCRDGQFWEVLCVPAKCERRDDPVGRKVGEYLWPEWFQQKHWAIYQSKPRTWSALYQQRPVPESGLHMQRQEFQRFEFGQQPSNTRKYMSSDFAVTDEQARRRINPQADPDFSEHGVFEVDVAHHVWITDWWYGKVETDVSVPQGVAMAKLHKPDVWFGEGGVIESAVGPMIRSEQRRRRDYTDRIIVSSAGEKLAKCRAFIGMVKARTVHVPNCEWGDRLIDMLCAFPAGHDDAFDTCGNFGRGLDQVFEAREPAPAVNRVVRPFTAEHIEYEERQRAFEDQERIRRYR